MERCLILVLCWSRSGFHCVTLINFDLLSFVMFPSVVLQRIAFEHSISIARYHALEEQFLEI